VAQEDAQERRLHRVEARVVTDVEELLLRGGAVEAQHADPLRELGSLTAIRPPSPSAKRFFVGKKLKSRRGSSRCRRAERLRRVFDHRDAEAGEVGRGATEQVHGHQRLRPVGDAPLDVGRVEVQRHRVDLGEHRRRAAARDRLGCGVERERRADHLVAGADPHRVHDEHQRVGPVRAADGLGAAEQVRRLALERLDLRAEDEAAGLERARERVLELRDQGRVLRLHVDVRDRHGRVRW
jgi:hypothetical protein